MKIRLLYLILAALLLLCLAQMPYGYYQLVRFIAMIMFAVFAYHNWRNGQQSFSIVFIALALLFQPFVKIALGRTMWNIVDVIVALGLIALWWLTPKKRGTK